MNLLFPSTFTLPDNKLSYYTLLEQTLYELISLGASHKHASNLYFLRRK